MTNDLAHLPILPIEKLLGTVEGLSARPSPIMPEGMGKMVGTMGKMTMPSDALDGLRFLIGLEIDGGCEYCDAYQTLSEPTPGVMIVTVHHDDWCRTHGVLW